MRNLKDWRAVRLRYLARVNPAVPEMDGSVPFVGMESIGLSGQIEFGETRDASEASGGLSCFEDGDVVIAKITPCFENGKCALARGVPGGRALGSTELHVLRPKPGIVPEFLFYSCSSSAFRGAGQASMFGAAGQKRVPTDFVKDYRLTFPNRDEQWRVVKFLDRETAKIDDLVSKKQRLLGLLAEKRTALISRAVTQGLDPSVPMNDSGVEWLGRVPRHWKLKALSRFCFSAKRPRSSRPISRSRRRANHFIGWNMWEPFTRGN